MFRLDTRFLLVAAALAPLAACSSTTDPGGGTTATPLSASEAGTLAAGFLSQANAAAGRETSTVNSDGTITYTAPCPLGGTITDVISSVTSTLDATRSGTLTSTSTLAPQGCIVGTGARQIAITGDPSLTVRSSTTFAAGVLTAGNMTVAGGFKWDGGGCRSNYTATTTVNGSTRTLTISGTICGHGVNVTQTL